MLLVPAWLQLHRYSAIRARAVRHQIGQYDLEPIDGSESQESVTLIDDVQDVANHDSDKG
jgi:hypothetical protein